MTIGFVSLFNSSNRAVAPYKRPYRLVLSEKICAVNSHLHKTSLVFFPRESSFVNTERSKIHVGDCGWHRVSR
jgi:hypothetical protein